MFFMPQCFFHAFIFHVALQDVTPQITRIRLKWKLEQLERLRSEDTPRRPVITYTIDKVVLNPKSILLTSSYRIPSQKKVKAKKISKICEKI